MPYTITVKRLDDGDYFAQYADIGLTKNNLMAGWGKSEAEAISDLKSAFKDALAQMLSDNEEIIEPKLLSHKNQKLYYYYERKYNARDRCRRKRARHFSFGILGYSG